MLEVQDRLKTLDGFITELVDLTNRPGSLSKRDEQRQAALMSAISALKLGASAAEVRNWEVDRLRQAAGLSRLPERATTKLPADVESEWRGFALGREVRATSVPSDAEVRANEAGQQSIAYTQLAAGGAFVPQGIHGRAFATMKQYDQIFDPEFSNVVETDTGGAMPFPVWDDVSNSSVQVGEVAQSGEVDLANFSSTLLNAYSFRSKIVAVSLELLQDSNFPFPALLERVFAMRHARGVGQSLATGSGVSAPTGLVTAVVASGASPVIASGSNTNTGGSETGATTIGTQDINTLFGKLDPAYRAGAAWYMNDATLTYLQGLLDKMGRPIVSFRKGFTGTDGDCPYILGKPVAICPSLPTMGAAKNSVLFGNPYFFVSRRVPSSMYVRRFWENPTLVQNGLVGFESWLRVDSGLVAPNSSFLPFQYIAQHS